MYQFFIEPSAVEKETVEITGPDVNHIKNVLRMHVGERIAAVNETEGRKYLCEIRKLEEECILCGILSKYVLEGRTKATLWGEAVQEDIFLLVLRKMQEIIRYWDKKGR